MSDDLGRFDWVASYARSVLFGTTTLLAIALIATVAMAIFALSGGPAPLSGVHWVLLAIVELVALLWSVALYGAVQLTSRVHAGMADTVARLQRVETVMEDATSRLKDLSELAPLSDEAKSLLFRERELEALREAIHEDLMKQDYKTAEALVDTIESRLGYAAEAAMLREEIEKARVATLEEKIDQAIRRIDELCAERKWTRALRESRRILELFPDNPKVAALPDRIRDARNDHKRELLQAYGEAVRKNDVDRGIELLRELDTYLTPQEGAALQESARGVFKARLHNLGVQFAICVTEQRWTDAIAAGEAIIDEFPNSRFAQEVREKMDHLRDRGAETP